MKRGLWLILHPDCAAHGGSDALSRAPEARPSIQNWDFIGLRLFSLCGAAGRNDSIHADGDSTVNPLYLP
jgi:hypothetical protein